MEWSNTVSGGIFIEKSGAVVMETDNCVFIGVACSDCSFSECVSVVCVGFIKQLVLSQHPILCVYGAGPLLIVLASAYLYHIHTHARAHTHT